MGVIVSKDDEVTSKLTERINADLRERAEKKGAMGGKNPNSKDQKDPDLVEDSDYTRNLKKTGKYSWIWVVLIVLALVSLVVISLI